MKHKQTHLEFGLVPSIPFPTTPAIRLSVLARKWKCNSTNPPTWHIVWESFITPSKIFDIFFKKMIILFLVESRTFQHSRVQRKIGSNEKFVWLIEYLCLFTHIHPTAKMKADFSTNQHSQRWICLGIRSPDENKISTSDTFGSFLSRGNYIWVFRLLFDILPGFRLNLLKNSFIQNLRFNTHTNSKSHSETLLTL